MKKRLVKKLEKRQLLSAAGSSPFPPLAQSSETARNVARWNVASQDKFDDFFEFFVVILFFIGTIIILIDMGKRLSRDNYDNSSIPEAVYQAAE